MSISVSEVRLFSYLSIKHWVNDGQYAASLPFCMLQQLASTLLVSSVRVAYLISDMSWIVVNGVSAWFVCFVPSRYILYSTHLHVVFSLSVALLKRHILCDDIHAFRAIVVHQFSPYFTVCCYVWQRCYCRCFQLLTHSFVVQLFIAFVIPHSCIIIPVPTCFIVYVYVKYGILH